MMRVQGFLSWFNGYTKAAAVNNERRLVLLSGSESWAMSLLHTIDGVKAALNTDAEKDIHISSLTTPCLIYGDSTFFPANIQKKRYRDKLGSESELIIFADSEFSIDAFAGLSGTLKAGGVLFLVIPSVGDKVEQSLFFKRFSSLIEQMSSHTIITEWQTSLLPPCSALDNQINKSDVSTYPHSCLTEEQYNAVLAIEKVVSGQRKRPLVLTADRGRGKSSALAIACAQLMKVHEHDEFRIVITAPDIQALSVFYRQLKQSLMSIEQHGNNIIFGKARLTFIAVDQLIREPIKVNLLLVDEAAAIPVYLLEQLLQNYHRMVFSSTVHGYEGAGRGFTLKFQKTLDRLCPQWVSLHLKQPIRWRENDPLEQLVFDACLLNAELPDLKATFVPQSLVNDKSSSANKIDSLNKFDETIFKVITAEKLVADEVLLKQVFAVLVTAHYQTKPSDLQLLLDNPQVQVTCLFSSNSKHADLLAVALLMNEGKFNKQCITEEELKAVTKSQRRLRNNFIPQSLLTQCGVEQAFDFHYVRVMRIAVHPQIQHQGVGSFFLNEMTTFAKLQGADFLASSFGATKSLLSFWLTADFKLGRIGFSKDKASGEQSALVLKSLSANAEQALVSINTVFYRCFDYLLVEEYKHLATNLVALIQQYCPQSSLMELTPLDKANVEAFAHGHRQYSTCVFSLHLWLKQQICNQHINDEVLFVLIGRIMQKHSVTDICSTYHFTGKKALEQFLKASVMSGLITNC